MLSDFNDLPRDKHVLSLDWHMAYNQNRLSGCLALSGYKDMYFLQIAS